MLRCINRRGLLQGVFPMLRRTSDEGGNKSISHYSSSSQDYEPQYKRLEGKVAVITGAASGIGAAASRLFVAHGAYVVMADIQEEAGKRLSQELGASAEFVHCDVTKDADVAATMKKASSAKGHIDILYSNAGIIGALGPLDQTNMQEFDYTMSVNLRGSVLAMKHATPVMKIKQTGSIVCTGSSAAILAGVAPHAYTISKAAMAGLVRSAALELRQYGIRVNMVSPHGTSTPLMKAAFDAVASSPVSEADVEGILRSVSPLPDRILNPIDIARAALFLASEESAYISGHNLVVDASYTVTTPTPVCKSWFEVYSPMLREAGGKRDLS